MLNEDRQGAYVRLPRNDVCLGAWKPSDRNRPSPPRSPSTPAAHAATGVYSEAFLGSRQSIILRGGEGGGSAVATARCCDPACLRCSVAGGRACGRLQDVGLRRASAVVTRGREEEQEQEQEQEQGGSGPSQLWGGAQPTPDGDPSRRNIRPLPGPGPTRCV
eukprot:scaffold3540_cov379-Prasinococcus_capsulatus_cf.AAC.19